MIVSYHDYKLSSESFINGANYYYIENNKLLKEQKLKNLKPIAHNFRNLILGKEKFPDLTKEDVVLSNVGPYAHVYHYLREKYNLKFRIIRDVQACLWPGYLLQEKICSKYTRNEDKVMFLSEFARQLYIKLFPETLNKENTFVCAPFMHFFPKFIKNTKRKDDDNLILGWIGRVALEKNFFQALNAFIRLYKERGNTKFIVAGDSNNKMKSLIKKKLRKNKIKSDAFQYINEGHFIPHKYVWDIYKKMDVFLFPSLSLNESLGRTLVEACYMGVPVISAYYGAAPEILSEKNLISVNYRNSLLHLDGDKAYSFGSVNMAELMDKLYNHKRLSSKNNIARYMNHDKKFFNILQNNELSEKLSILNKNVREFVNNVYLYQDYTNLDIKKVMCRTKKFISSIANNNLTMNKMNIQKKNNYSTKFIFNRESYYCLDNYHFFIPAFLNYRPYATLNKEGIKIKFQKSISHFKKPFRKPVKVAFYFYVKYKYFNTDPQNFNAISRKGIL